MQLPRTWLKTGSDSPQPPRKSVGAGVGMAACVGFMTHVLRVVQAGAGAACIDTTKSDKRHHSKPYWLCS
jgi:hypothetical protein